MEGECPWATANIKNEGGELQGNVPLWTASSVACRAFYTQTPEPPKVMFGGSGVSRASCHFRTCWGTADVGTKQNSMMLKHSHGTREGSHFGLFSATEKPLVGMRVYSS